MTTVADWGRPTEGIFQTAFVVEDLEQAMAQFSARFNVGPWAVFRDNPPVGAHYRGEPLQAVVHLAFGYTDGMTYELIELADENPSVFRDLVEVTGYGFHHFGYGTRTLDADVAKMQAEGYEPIGTLNIPDIRLAMFDTRDVMPGMTELIEVR